jgi:hypothetical protein
VIKAHVGNRSYHVDGLANRGKWFGKTWLIMIGMGFESFNVIVEADNANDAIDELTDSHYGHLIKTDDTCEYCEREDYDRCVCTFGGNGGERVDLDNVQIYRCKVDYFAKRDST